MPETEKTIASPCISVCELDEQDLCLGCGRTLDEIGAWMAASDEEKARIVELALQRKLASQQRQSVV